MTFYPGADRDNPTFEVDVSDPGYGRLHIRRLDDRYPVDAGREPWGTFTGAGMWSLLQAVTALAAGRSGQSALRISGASGAPLIVTRDEAQHLLGALTEAVVLAIAGSERYERVVQAADEQDLSPAEPLCVKCNEGSPYSHAVTISSWCSEYGHSPFGVQEGVSWSRAAADYERQRRLHHNT